VAGIIGWITSYGSYLGFVVQIVFYLVVAGSAAWAAVTFARYVKFMTSAESEVESKPDTPELSVEKFVD